MKPRGERIQELRSGADESCRTVCGECGVVHGKDGRRVMMQLIDAGGQAGRHLRDVRPFARLQSRVRPWGDPIACADGAKKRRRGVIRYVLPVRGNGARVRRQPVY